jgi:hypothetical protein
MPFCSVRNHTKCLSQCQAVIFAVDISHKTQQQVQRYVWLHKIIAMKVSARCYFLV